ncbi:MAG: hypothetical protein ABH811_03085 [archaeon]
MNKEKIVVILLLITIILSIGSMIVTFSLNVGERLSNFQSNQISLPNSNAGNINLEIEKNNGGVD